MELKQLVKEMTLEEKAGLCSGLDFWRTTPVDRLGIPSIMVADGPHGLRKQSSNAEGLGLRNSVPATCFPTASVLASSWDRELLFTVGQALGEECLENDVSVILGPGVNIKRSPVCGRNFEYFSEDPFLAGEIAKSHIRGVQSQGVGTSLKHFAANNQEYKRLTIDAIVDERTLREIYLPGFETAVKEAQPWTVMCAYNKLNGTYASENPWLLTQVLRQEWGFNGIVVSDWGAVNERPDGVKAGLDLEMPSSQGFNDARIVKAVRDGTLAEAVLDQMVERLLTLIFKGVENRRAGYTFDRAAHHQLARRVAAEGAVLLTNTDGILPLNPNQKIAVLGAFAKSPKFQAYGSSLINPIRVDSAWDELEKVTGGKATFAPGYDLMNDAVDSVLIEQARETAKNADVVLVFAGLTDLYESEGYDRGHMRLPDNHNALIEATVAVNPNVVVVLNNGAPVEMPWVGKVKAVLECYLAGQAGGAAAVDILFGTVNPSGKLAETFPMKFEDNPSYNYFPQGPVSVEYREGIFVGYRYYDTAHKEVLFPFGHGLSYTRFEYSDLQVGHIEQAGEEMVTVTLKVRNTGPVDGKEIVQLYVRDVEASVIRPEKELKGFEKVSLHPGEEKEVSFSLGKRAFAFYDTNAQDWVVEAGRYEILVGASSRDIRLSAEILMDGKTQTGKASLPKNLAFTDAEFGALFDQPLPVNRLDPKQPFTLNTPLGDLPGKPWGQRIYQILMKSVEKEFPTGGGSDKTQMITNRLMHKIIQEMPLRALANQKEGINMSIVEGMMHVSNGNILKGLLKLLQGRLEKPKKIA